MMEANEIYTNKKWESDEIFLAAPGQEIESDIYENMFEVVPPISLPRAPRIAFPVQVTTGFMVSEPYINAVVEGGLYKTFYSAFGRIGKRYYFLGYYSHDGYKYPESIEGWK